MSLNYSKQIKVTSTGMVIATIYRNDESIGLSFFHNPFDAGLFKSSTNPDVIKVRCNKAHKWADAYMKECKNGEEIRQENK
jgi:hypothetical protein